MKADKKQAWGKAIRGTMTYSGPSESALAERRQAIRASVEIDGGVFSIHADADEASSNHYSDLWTVKIARDGKVAAFTVWTGARSRLFIETFKAVGWIAADPVNGWKCIDGQEL